MATGGRRVAAVLLAVVVGLPLAAIEVGAAVTKQGNCPSAATAMGNAITDQAGLMTSAAWVHYSAGALPCPPGSGAPAGTSNAAITASFGPPVGPDFGILSSGDVASAPLPNTSGSTSYSYGDSFSGARDVTTLRVDINVPAGHNVLFVDAQFLSEEWPEYVGSFSDALIIELDGSTWSASGMTITAPKDFAFDGNCAMLFVANPTMSAASASGSTYDGATPRVTTKSPITPGPHSVYFSIFDTSDTIYDSTAFIDNMHTGVGSAGSCFPTVSPAFGYSFGTGCATMAFSFVDASTASPGPIVSWLWDFGNGQTSTLQNPSYTYPNEGTYPVTLTVKDGAGIQQSITQNVVASLASACALFPMFDFTIGRGCGGLDTSFLDRSKAVGGLIVSWSWNFGDGAVAYEKNPGHLYSEAGSYDITLTVYDNQGHVGTAMQHVTFTGTTDCGGSPGHSIAAPPDPPKPPEPEQPITDTSTSSSSSSSSISLTTSGSSSSSPLSSTSSSSSILSSTSLDGGGCLPGSVLPACIDKGGSSSSSKSSSGIKVAGRPDTGDGSPATGWVGLGVAAALGGLCVVAARRRGKT